MITMEDKMHMDSSMVTIIIIINASTVMENNQSKKRKEFTSSWNQFFMRFNIKLPVILLRSVDFGFSFDQ